MSNIPYAVAFGAGLLSFLSPCVLPMVPVYLASICGPGVFETTASKNRFPMFFHSLSFVGGFSLLFILLGVGAGLVGFALSAHMDLIRKISGIVLIAFGLFMFAALKFPQLNWEKRVNKSGSTAISYWRSFLTGVVFCLAWTPCVSPALGSILALAWSSETANQGGVLLAIYSLGFGIPFLVIGAAFSSLHPVLKRLNRYSYIFYIIGGVFLVGVGVLILTNRLGWLQGL